MLRFRMKRLIARDARAVHLLAEIERSVTSLDNEDLLDIADIFRGKHRGPLGDMAVAEMAKRNISLQLAD